jgi:hypothetical protein
MIPVPASLTVARSKKAEATLLLKCRTWLEKQERAEGIHASDLALSPRISYWKRLLPTPLPDRLVTIFMVGRILHTLVLYAYDMRPLTPDLDSDEGSLKADHLGGLLYSPDKIIKGNIVELKTTRKPTAPDNTSDLEIYFPQILIYMAAEKKTTAWLWVLYLSLRDPVTKRTNPEFRAYKFEISAEELVMLQANVLAATKLFKKAVKTKNHRLLPLCPEWMCGAKNCEYFEKHCQPEGRYKG